MRLSMLRVMSLLSQLPSTAEDLPELWKAALRERTGARGLAVVMNETARSADLFARLPACLSQAPLSC